MRPIASVLLLTLATLARAAEPVSNFRDEFWPALDHAIPGILASQDKATGRFGTGIWVVNDQHAMWPLAVAWGADRPNNPHFHNPAILEAVMKAGDALIDDMDPTGKWEFRKKDGSTWGPIYMPWTYSRWIRAYGIIKDAMPPERRARWEKALTLGVEGIIREALPGPIHNIPATDAAAVYHAGQLFNRDDWKKTGADYLRRTAAAQDPSGFWVENAGPVIAYNFVYVDALAFYLAKSGDDTVLPALQRAATYHAHFTYPDGRMVETVDQRNAYELNRGVGGVGFTFSPEGRGFIQQQLDLMKADKQPIPADTAASVIAYGIDGLLAPTPRSKSHDRFVLGNNDALTARQGPWFACISAYTAPVGPTRWIQDRQNFLSLYHDQIGSLVLGGGNTKLQPLWSSFTAGDTSLLSHKPGDENPTFTPPPGLLHIPSKAKLDPDQLAVTLTYGQADCRISLDIADPQKATVTYSLETPSTLPVEAHATFLPDEKLAKGWKTASGKEGKLQDPFKLTSEEAGGWFEHNGWRVHLPAHSTIVWPAMMHNQYAKDGKPQPFQARIVVLLPLGTTPAQEQVTIEIPQ
jgi:hypothetical protein